MLIRLGGRVTAVLTFLAGFGNGIAGGVLLGFEHDADSMKSAAEAAMKFNATLPNDRFAIPERSPIAAGTGRKVDQSAIKQFPGKAS